ncbi:hypothetical protein [Saccharopolyspora tripterygii]
MSLVAARLAGRLPTLTVRRAFAGVVLAVAAGVATSSILGLSAVG